MIKATRELFKRALELPEGQRLRLARTLLESVDLGDDEAEPELSPEWRAELERRIADADDPEKWISGDELLAKLQRAQKRDEAKARRKRPRGA